MDDLFDDFFAPIARDGAALLEVDVRLLKALASLAQINPELFQKSCAKHADILLKRANSALTLQEDKDQLRALARPLAV